MDLPYMYPSSANALFKREEEGFQLPQLMSMSMSERRCRWIM